MDSSTLATLITILDLAGVAVFAVTGALVASRKQMDIVGFALLATVTGIGGGTFRDLVLGVAPVFWVQQPVYVGLCIGVAAVVFFTAHIPESRYRLLLWLDAIGLSVFCVVGADKALEAGASPFIAVVMGVITATFGGVVRDVLGGEIPVILRREIYATAALAGAATFVVTLRLDLPGASEALIGFAVCLAIRSLALWRGWSLPVYLARPGRSPDEIGRR
ncbi:trimeric intracellular cation channel family protein [Pseudorhodoplanes sp.]|uniref:trimeric intracellular cation channel family protein n=1 Tax=Pseudorhodoplanes sp. TaxID=1934341 RepID=UPI00391D3050